MATRELLAQGAGTSAQRRRRDLTIFGRPRTEPLNRPSDRRQKAGPCRLGPARRRLVDLLDAVVAARMIERLLVLVAPQVTLARSAFPILFWHEGPSARQIRTRTSGRLDGDRCCTCDRP